MKTSLAAPIASVLYLFAVLQFLPNELLLLILIALLHIGATTFKFKHGYEEGVKRTLRILHEQNSVEDQWNRKH